MIGISWVTLAWDVAEVCPRQACVLLGVLTLPLLSVVVHSANANIFRDLRNAQLQTLKGWLSS